VAAIFVTAVQLYLEFKQTKRDIKADMQSIGTTFDKSLTDAVFNYNDQLISSILLGIEKNNIVTGALLLDEKGQKIESKGELKAKEKEGFSEKHYSVTYPVLKENEGKTIQIGTLKIYSSHKVVIQRVKYGFLLILINSLIKTAFLWLVMVYFLNKYLSKPLIKMSQGLEELDSQKLKPLSLEYDYKNEFSFFKDSFNRLIEKISQLHSKIKTENEKLEERVAHRTKNLEQANEEILKLAKTKSDFLANVSHEIRTPMNGLIGMMELLDSGSLSKEQEEQVAVAKSCAENLLVIVNDVLDISKIESGKIDLENEYFDLHNCLKEAFSISEYAAKSKGIELILNISDDTPEVLKGDVTRFKQIILNFLTNAIKFTSKGKVELQSKKMNNRIEFSVIDTGIGISKEAQKEIFEEFSQADNSITRRFGGTGLGLSIAKKLAQLMDGEIAVESSEGEGSRFTFRYPYKEADSTFCLLDIKKKEDLKSDSSPSFKKILVVDDNTVNQKVLSMILKKLGYESDIASNGEEVLEMVAKTSYQLIFMDMQMPVMDGVTATKKLVEIYGANCPSIIAVTGNANSEDREACFNAGMIDHISKPVKIEDIRVVLKKVLELEKEVG
tara:strand:- start:302852 stop:304693 length:1842 start_codon:yes stop_codon:yes gene_type:complete